MKNQIENPNGLHRRYKITKVKIEKNPFFGFPDPNSQYGKRRLQNEYVVKEVAVDKDAEYFVLRLDMGGSDIEHIKAARIGIHAYAAAIKHHIPELANDLVERYPLL